MEKSLEIKNLFLSDSYNEQLDYYNKIINEKRKYLWDIVVITASNKTQGSLYEKQIELRKVNGLLPQGCEFLIIPDPGDKRVGSGGATFNVIKLLSKKFKNLEKLKILLIHSGGDSKRIPQYSSIGKLFSPVPRVLSNCVSSTLFDEILIMFSMVPLRMDAGMLVACGDSLLLFNPLQLDFQYKDIVSVSMKAPVKEGEEHGVLVDNVENKVEKFLHKCPKDVLRKNKAIKNDLVNIDTGVIYFSFKVLRAFLNLIEENETLFINDNSRLNIYGDVLYPFALDSNLEDYLKEPAEIEINEQIISSRKKLWKLKKDFSYHLIKLSPASYIHFGTSFELLELMTTELNQYESIGWRRNINSILETKDSCAIDSKIINSEIQKSFVENSEIINCKIGENCIISNCKLNNLEVPNNIVLSTLKLKSGYVTRIYSVHDNPKRLLKAGFLNYDINKVIEKYNISLDLNCDLWKACLYPVCKTKEESLLAALNLFKIITLQASVDEYNNWNNSLKESLYTSFIKAIPEDNKKLIIEIIKYQIVNAINNKDDLKKLTDYLRASIYKKDIINMLKRSLKEFNNYYKMRIYYILSMLDQKNNEEYYNCIFSSVKNLVSEEYVEESVNYKVLLDEVVVKSPVRVNFSGQWSDTPPYCIENGGTVLNVAVKLNNELPIVVRIKRIKEKKFILESKDLGSKVEIDNLVDIWNCFDPNDSFALLKSAIIISNLISKQDKCTADVYNRIGGGVHIITAVNNIPRGSGLGTSSILSGALLKALSKFMGIQKNDLDISNDVLRLEQLMSTGGGWQDQVGGIFPGLKLISTNPGIKQDLNVRVLKVSDDFLKNFSERFILINTGQRRLARNILRNIVLKYISNNKQALNIFERIQEIARLQADLLVKENYEYFGALLNEHWELIKQLEPSSSNMCIESILKVIENDVYGMALCGAAGGGFIMAVLKNNVKINDIKEKLAEVFADTDVQVYKIQVYEGE